TELEKSQATQLAVRKKELEHRISSAANPPRVFAGTYRQPDEIHLLYRGDPEQPRERVPPAIPAVLGDLRLPENLDEPARRRRLADWIVDPANPLTARVMVNRIWQGHFGTGLVSTPSDFGRMGMKPSHPELLDWLSAEFIRGGWSVKHLHRLIVLSATYGQSSEINAAAAARDSDVRLLWRFPNRRLDAESIRDSLLSVSGQLNPAMHGRGFNLFGQRGGLSGFTPVETFTPENQRRMIYAHKVRREPETVFGAFDCPDAGQSTAVRRVSTTPIQALNLFNSPFTLAQADAFAARVMRECGGDAAAAVDRAWQLALSRPPDAGELEDALPVVREHGLPALCRALFNCNEFMFLP
ncbi:MAG: Planctomycete cytochrome, partial [Verrucomicrobiales bacterium]|nr:Planctomycete cytochrome [Verrucomicrobiales bacterium]